MRGDCVVKTYKLFFEPDRAVPQFKRLRFEEVDVPLRDVLLLFLR